MYWPRLSNYTLLPSKLAACNYVTDAMDPGTEYPYAVQMWNASTNNWDTITDVDWENYCHPYGLGMIQTELVSKRLWPGMSVDVMDGEATAARAPLQKGDKFRFVVFTSTDRNSAWKTSIASVPSVIQEQVIRGDASFNIEH